MPDTELKLREIVSTPVNSIADVIASFEAIETLLPQSDGLYWFNWLYLTVTKSVGEAVKAMQWHNPEWLARLDVVFARLYLSAMRDALAGNPAAPRCWGVLLNARHNARLARIQFAAAGMNAHIDHDLCIAVVSTCRQMGLVPTHGSTLYSDYTQVNRLLDALIDDAKQGLRVGLLGQAIPDLGRLEDMMAGFGIHTAREAAWTSAEVLWHMQALPPLAARYLAGLDRATALAGAGLLVPVL